MTRKLLISIAMLMASSLCISTASAQFIVDNFEVDSSAMYSVIDDGNAASGDGTPDSTSAFAFDYITAGLPLAPNSLPTDRGGLRFAANETDSDAGAPDHITAFHITPVVGDFYSLQVDIFMGVESAGGSTEFSTVGIGSSATDFNSIFTPIAGDGHFLSMTGEGGSSSDFRHYAGGIPVASGDASYLNSDMTTNATGDTYQSIFPGGDFPGSPGNRWTTLTITVNPTNVTYALDGTPIIQTPNLGSDGQVGLGLTDAFSSVGPHFVVFDNLTVNVVPEPAGMMPALLGLGGLMLIRRRR